MSVLHGLLNDFRLALRSLGRNPGVTAACVLTLALGIGANTAIFSVIHQVLLRPLPYSDPDHLTAIWESQPNRPRASVSGPDFRDWQRDNTSFEAMAAVSSWASVLTGDGTPEMFLGRSVSSNFFSVLGVEAAIGRTFDPRAAAGEELYTVVLEHSFWKQRFGGDRSVVGKSLILDGEAHSVLGVLPADFQFPGSFQALFWLLGKNDLPRVPQNADAIAENRAARYFTVIGRLKPGVEVFEAQTEMGLLMERYADAYPDTNAQNSAVVTQLLEVFVGDVSSELWMLMGAVFFVLLIACANIANLLLARTAERRKGLVIRSALGATRSALIRQMLVESVVLAWIAGLLGLPLAVMGGNALAQLAPEDLPRLGAVGISVPILLFTFGLSLLTGALCGLLPAFQISGFDLRSMLEAGGRGQAGSPGQRHLRNLFVTSQVALSLVLLVGLGLLLRSFVNVRSVDPGFDARRVLSMGLILPHTKYGDPAQIAIFHRQLLENLDALPDVESASLVSHLPFGNTSSGTDMEIEGRSLEPGESLEVGIQVISEKYFETLGIPILQGRSILSGDTADSERVVMVNQHLARTFWPGESAIGKRLRKARDSEGNWWTVVGVAGDVHQRGPEQEVRSEVFYPYQQVPSIFINLVVRTRGEPLDAEQPIRAQVAAVDKTQPVYQVMPLEQLVADSTAERRFTVLLLGLLAAVALFMALLGIYAVVSYSTTRRDREIAIRLALGAYQKKLQWWIVRQGMAQVALGIGLGLVLAFFAARGMRSMLFGIGGVDGLIFILVPALFLVIAVVAGYLPARKAMIQVEPANTLRSS